jgi:hypothetical protein
MLTTAVVFASFFSFGYCIADIIINARSAKRIDEMLRSTIENDREDCSSIQR